MRDHSLRLTAVLLCLAVAIGLFASPAWSGDSGTLKLKVRQCLGNNWISGASVEVSIQRSGSGEVDSAKGTTDGSGCVDFTFYDLEDGDEAHVTVTPGGMNPDSSHVYDWVVPDGRAGGNFELAADSDSICDDGWYDMTNRIFLCKYH
jgi:hypothetical protein